MNQTSTITRAMILAAGLGTRMRPITETIPKPLVHVAGKTMLDHALDALADAGVTDTAINVHYLPDQIIDHVALRECPRVTISDERDTLLDSGGGVKKAISGFPNGPFYILNADSFWLDSTPTNLSGMAGNWREDDMDMQLLVARKDSAVGFDGPGDFFMDDSGRLSRRGKAASAPYVYAGAIIAKAQLLNAIAEAKFSLNRLFDDAIARNRLFGCCLQGLWLHVGTPAAIEDAERAINEYRLQGEEAQVRQVR